jgi:DNA repair protein RecO (recombination protein O)
MALKKERGIVIQSLDIGDSDRMISLAGASDIRLKFISKGIRKSKRRAISSTELGSLVEIDFYDQLEKDWKSIKEINLINRYDQIKSTYPGTLLMIYFCEMISTLYPEGESHPFLYQLLTGSFEYTESNGIKLALLPFFKLRALANLGHFPTEFFCHTCGESVFNRKSAYFDLENREFLCGDCHTLPRDQLMMIRFFHTILVNRFSKVMELHPARDLIKETDQVLNQFLRSITGKELKSYFEFYKTIGDSFL